MLSCGFGDKKNIIPILKDNLHNLHNIFFKTTRNTKKTKASAPFFFKQLSHLISLTASAPLFFQTTEPSDFSNGIGAPFFSNNWAIWFLWRHPRLFFKPADFADYADGIRPPLIENNSNNYDYYLHNCRHHEVALFFVCFSLWLPLLLMSKCISGCFASLHC